MGRTYQVPIGFGKSDYLHPCCSKKMDILSGPSSNGHMGQFNNILSVLYFLGIAISQCSHSAMNNISSGGKHTTKHV